MVFDRLTLRCRTVTRRLPSWLLLACAAPVMAQQPAPVRAPGQAPAAVVAQAPQAIQVRVQAAQQEQLPLVVAPAGPPAAPQQAGAAPQDNTTGIAGAIAQESQAWLDRAVAAMRPTGAAPLRMVVQVGALDSRLSLAPCNQIEPYLPPGTRLWGKTRIGLRCVDGVARWNVFLPVQVQAFGQTWVMRADVAAGAQLTRDDAVLAEVDWAEDDRSVLADPEMWLGQTATRRLSTGQTLRHGMVKPSQVFQAGSMVRVVAQGPGFSVTSDGQALSAGIIGEMVRVRIDNGRIVSGTVLDMRTVRINL